jgi:hypothetical protein
MVSRASFLHISRMVAIVELEPYHLSENKTDALIAYDAERTEDAKNFHVAYTYRSNNPYVGKHKFYLR